MIGLVWLRQDLRTHDNSALQSALDQCDQVIAIWLKCEQHAYSPLRQALQLDTLIALEDQLAELGVKLVVAQTTSYRHCVDVIVEQFTRQKANRLFANREHGVDELQRDEAVSAVLDCQFFGSDTIQPLGSVLNGSGQMYKVFTPFAKQWRKLADVMPIESAEARSKHVPIRKDERTHKQLTSWRDQLPQLAATWMHTPRQIDSQLKAFAKDKIHRYHTDRDFPARAGTSLVSAYLAIGALSVRRCYQAALDQPISEGRDSWINELIWREFYRHLMYAFPRLSKSKAFQTYTEKVPWNYNQAHFAAWCEGRTGFPIVDAAMRCLNQTGWMHNRLRMIVGSFLCKDLGIDWRSGEKYFESMLIDADFPSNNGGWQWAASTGADAAPYFRIFNPTRQSERFDPEGEFIKQWVPELSALDKKQIHAPSQALRASLNYPEEIIDRRKTKDTIVAAFKHAKASTG